MSNLVPAVAPAPVTQKSLTLVEMAQLAKAAVASKHFKDLTVASAIIRMQMGRELGLGPAASLRNIYLVGDTPSFAAGYIAARLKQSGRYNYRITKHTLELCEIQFVERGPNGLWEEAGVSAFAMEDAKRANLLKPGSGWQKYPKAMLFSRALTQGVRWYAPDVLAGVVAYTPEELGAEPAAEDLIDVEVEPSRQQTGGVEYLEKLVAEKRADRAAILIFFGVEKFEDLTPAQYAKALQTLQSR